MNKTKMYSKNKRRIVLGGVKKREEQMCQIFITIIPHKDEKEVRKYLFTRALFEIVLSLVDMLIRLRCLDMEK